ncbi:MAG: hypothetical protein AB1633_11925 [Elusimicrobiota bacterium]
MISSKGSKAILLRGLIEKVSVCSLVEAVFVFKTGVEVKDLMEK